MNTTDNDSPPYQQLVKNLLPYAFKNIITNIMSSIFSSHNKDNNIYSITIVSADASPNDDNAEHNKSNIQEFTNSDAYSIPRSSISSDLFQNNKIDPVTQLKVNDNKLTASIPRNSLGPTYRIPLNLHPDMLNKCIYEEKELSSERKHITNEEKSTENELNPKADDIQPTIIKSKPNDINAVRTNKTSMLPRYSLTASFTLMPKAESNKVSSKHSYTDLSIPVIQMPVYSEYDKFDVIGFVLEDMHSMGGDKFDIPKDVIVSVLKQNKEIGLATCAFKGLIGLFPLKYLKIANKKKR